MNTLLGGEAKANSPLIVRGRQCRRPQSDQAQRQEGSHLLGSLFDRHAIGIECVLQIHGGRFPDSNGAADSARQAWKSALGKFPAFAERT
jgi:hypothetical protein